MSLYTQLSDGSAITNSTDPISTCKWANYTTPICNNFLPNDKGFAEYLHMMKYLVDLDLFMSQIYVQH